MNILVTGGGGFLGGAVVRMLRQRGEKVRSFQRGHARALSALGVEVVQGDLRDPQALARACEGVDVVFHVAAKAGVWGKREEYEAINVGGTLGVLSACQQARVPYLVYTSSPSVVHEAGGQHGADESLPYPTEYLTDYPRTKAEAERAVLAANSKDLKVVALRPHLIWGPGDPHLLPRLAERSRQGRLRRIGTDDPLIDTTYIDNAALAHVLAADKLRAGAPVDGKVYFITNGEPIGCWTMINRMLAAVGAPTVEKTVSPELAFKAGGALEWVWRTFNLKGEPPMTRFVARELSTAHYYDISAARRDLGYIPTVTLEQGLERLARAGLSAEPPVGG